MKSLRYLPTAAALALLCTFATACGLLPRLSAEPTQPPTDQPTLPPVPPTQPPPPPTTPPPTAIPTVHHVTIPTEPLGVTSYITDASTYALQDEHTSYGDRFSVNIYERPYTSQDMDYLDFIDIHYAELYRHSPWIYVTIYLLGEPPTDTKATYSVEIDTDLDGRGEWLITAFAPPSTEWTTDGVYVLHDADGDVGAATPVLSDAPTTGLNGYEEMVFQNGYGADPDSAWARRVPDEPEQIQLAFKIDLLQDDGAFLWGVIAERNNNVPAWYDFNDRFPIDVAGSPLLGDPNYPVQELAAVDSTCRYAVGFTPSGSEPMLCGPEECEPVFGHVVCENLLCVCVPGPCPIGLQCTPCIIPCE
jgi:hypothetical protein